MIDKKLEIKQIFDVPMETVWDAWTNPESLKQWKSPEGMTTPEVDVHLTVGGTYRIVMEGHDMPNPAHNGKMAITGEYLEIEKPTKLVYTWLWEGAPAGTHTTTVTILLRKLDEERTELTLIHSGFADENMYNEHNKGWVSTLKSLQQFLAH